MEVRRAFCEKWIDRDEEKRDIDTIVMSDEKLFKLRCDHKMRVRRRRGTAFERRHINYSRKSGGHADVMVYIFITRFGKGGLFIAENRTLYDSSGEKIRVLRKGEKRPGFTGDCYYEMLKYLVVPAIQSHFEVHEPEAERRAFVYQQDNAPPHSSKNLIRNPGQTVERLLTEQKIKLMKPWPPRSPDFNPVEHVWHLLNEIFKRKIRSLKNLPRNKKQTFNLIKTCWSKLDNAKVVSIYNSFLNRLKEVLTNNGDNNNRY